MYVSKRSSTLVLLAMLLNACGGGGGNDNVSNIDTPARANMQITAAPDAAHSDESSKPSTALQPTHAGGAPDTVADPANDFPSNDLEAARFLAQTTFGPTRADIAHLRRVGYSRWLDEQMDPARTPPTLMEPHILSIPARELDDRERRNYWLWQAVNGKDQLRMRMGFALSQIFVVSDHDLSTVNHGRIANYQDMLAIHAFGNYRQLLEKVSLHPAMAQYLGHMQNQKETRHVDSSGRTIAIAPDENYAREIMQLFSIGLFERNPDFSLKRGADGNPIPTYDQDVVAAMARVFTGWTWASNSDQHFLLAAKANETRPMICNRLYHDDKPKSIFRGIVIDEGNDCRASLGRALDALADHPNTAPFIGRQLIQRFVTSNPSPAYVERVSNAWTLSGGDFKQVLKAILLDPEARTTPKRDAVYGKVREPLIQLTTLWRAFNASYRPRANGHYSFGMARAGDLTIPLGQDSLRAPSVFNFYTPDYRLLSLNGDTSIYAPEFELYNETRFISIMNQQHAATGYVRAGPIPAGWSQAPLLDVRDLHAQAERGEHRRMVMRVNTLLHAGALPPQDIQVMVEMLDKLKTQKRSSSERVRSLLQLALANPEFVIQR